MLMEEAVTVLEDEQNYNAKHQLQHAWTLWHNGPPKGKTKFEDWLDSLDEIYTMDTVEDFWRCVCMRMTRVLTAFVAFSTI